MLAARAGLRHCFKQDVEFVAPTGRKDAGGPCKGRKYSGSRSGYFIAVFVEVSVPGLCRSGAG